jgi:hypothetical protein
MQIWKSHTRGFQGYVDDNPCMQDKVNFYDLLHVCNINLIVVFDKITIESSKWCDSLGQFLKKVFQSLNLHFLKSTLHIKF